MGKEEGYKNLIPAKKGEVRNPNGKPKGTLHLSTHIRNMLEDEEFQAQFVSPDGKKVEFKGHPVKAIISTAIVKAIYGDKQWADWIAVHGYGSKLTIVHEDPILRLLIEYGIKEGGDDDGQPDKEV